MSDISRRRIIEETDKNFFVEAGAGSGKTTILVERMVSMIKNGIDINKICTITYTKPAAREFYSRFRNRLAEESTNEQCKVALENIDLCFMGTIDSFCQMVISEHPMEAGIPSDSSVIETDTRNALVEQELAKIRNGKCGEELKKKYEKVKNIFYNADTIILAGLDIASDVRGTKLQLPDIPTNEPDEYFLSERKMIAEMLEYFKDNSHLILDNTKGSKAVRDQFEEFAFLSESWNGKEIIVKIQNKLKQLRDARISPDADKDLVPYFSKFFEEKELRNKFAYYGFSDTGLLNETIRKIDDYTYSITMDFIAEVSNHTFEMIKNKGTLDFKDYLILLRDMLKKDAEKDGKLIKHIYERHGYFLVDEFQDTNPIQSEILFYLTAKTPNADLKKCVPHPGSLFIVGDPKQSIYSFNNADVASFLNIKERFSDPTVGECLPLVSNFRSSDNMCVWFNTVFSELLDQDRPTQRKFENIPTGKKSKYLGSLEGAYYIPVTYAQKVNDRKEYSQVADVIYKLVHNPGITIQVKEEKKYIEKPVSYQDIMVITPTKTDLIRYTQAFNEMEIPYKVEGAVNFAESDAVNSISRIYKAIANPYDKKATFGATVLSSCNVSEDLIREYRNKANHVTPAGLFNLLLDDERILSYVGVKKLEYVFCLQELLRTAEITGTVSSLQEAADFICRQAEIKIERYTSLEKESNKVRIANIHKIKGLQAPVVILAGAFEDNHSAERHVDYSKANAESYIFNIGNVRTCEYAAQEELANTNLADEETRKLYVAATRAESVLIVFKKSDAKGLRTTDYWYPFATYLDKNIYDELSSSEDFTPSVKVSMNINDLYDESENNSVLNNNESKEESYSIVLPSKIRIKSKKSEKADEENSVIPDSKRNAALIGTMVHRLMEVLVSSKNTADLDTTVKEIVDEYADFDSGYSDMLTTVGTKVRTGIFKQEPGTPEDMLSEILSADEAYCEVPFCYKKDKEIINGVMDVVYKKDNQWHIVDYKTNAETDDLGDKYAGQLNAYKDAFKELTGEDADAMIWHIEIEE